jgi:hypothetical protein
MSAIAELLAIKQALRLQRFSKLQNEIEEYVRAHAATALVVKFKWDETEVHIKSKAGNYRIRVRNVPPANTALEYTQGRLWCGLDDAGVQRLLEACVPRYVGTIASKLIHKSS